MKTVVLLYDTSCIYEIVILNYFLKFTGKDVVFVSLDANSITSMEGYSINVSGRLTDIPAKDIELIIVPGGNIKDIDNDTVWGCLRNVQMNQGIIAGICAGVDVLDHAGLLDGIASTHSTDLDVVVTDQIITSRANSYVDFAIEVAKTRNQMQSSDWKKYTHFFQTNVSYAVPPEICIIRFPSCNITYYLMQHPRTFYTSL